MLSNLVYVLRGVLRKLDLRLVFGLLCLLLIGSVTLYSASGANFSKVLEQWANLAAALTVLWIACYVRVQFMQMLALPLYVVGVLMLVGVELFGHISHGAQRWLDIGPLHIQPSELLKFGLPMMLAWFFQRYEENLRWWHFVFATVLILVPFVLILKQPDLGTSLLVASAGFFVLYFAGLSWKIIAGLATGFSAVCYVVLHKPLCVKMLQEYQCRRIETLLDPSQDPLGAGYHTLQGAIAIGGGGITGQGWLKGTQTHLEFLPERTTDFIFAVFSEEFGLVGNVVLLCVYAFIIFRGLSIAQKATSVYGRLMAGSITLTFFVYAFVNMGMVSGILPVVGVPLPLVSYGGTSLVTLMFGFGMLMAIAKDRRSLT